MGKWASEQAKNCNLVKVGYERLGCVYPLSNFLFLFSPAIYFY